MMKKFISFMMLMAMVALPSDAQKLEESKFRDNWFIGALGGVYMPLKSQDSGSTKEGQFGLRAGRWFTPYFALAVEGQAFFGKSGHFSVSRTAINVWNVSGMAMFNINNIIRAYQGSPRPFEVMAFVGIGGAGLCGAGWKYVKPSYDNPHPHSLTCSFGLDLAYNFGSKKQWQAFVEPRFMYELANENVNVQFNAARALFGLNVGISYYFRNSTGKHHFKLYETPDVGEYNSQINDLRANSAEKDKQLTDMKAEIVSLQQIINNYEKRDTVIQKNVYVTMLQPTVVFRQGKSIIDPEQFASIVQIARYMDSHPDVKVTIRGYASPEGDAAQNQKLSEQRAENVRNALVKKYGIDASRLTAIGCGMTDKMFREHELNRLVTFSEDSNE